MTSRVEVARCEGATPGAAVFLLVWFGQVVSLLGSGLTGFALGVWVYQKTGSATQLSVIAVCSRLPGILILPVAGALVDRWDRRVTMIFTDLGAGASILCMALLMFAGRLALWHICLAVAVNSALSAFQWPAYVASTTLMVPKKHFGRVSGLVTASDAIAQTVSPLLGAALMIWIKIEGIFLADFASFLFSAVTLLAVKFPTLVKTNESRRLGASLLKEVAYGWTYVSSRPGLLALLSFFACTNFFSGYVLVLITPLVLSFAPPQVLGTVLSVGGIGLLIGSLLMSAWGGPKRRMKGVFVFQTLCGFFIILAGLTASGKTIAIAAFAFFFCVPLIAGCSQAIWQSKVPPDVQGRVFAVRRMVAWSSVPLAYLSAGPLADYFFGPLLVSGGPLAGSIGRLTGVGPGRGIGFLFILMGMATVILVGAGYLYPRLRLLEDELADAIPVMTPAAGLAHGV
ncbi:MAG: MFS transporter [Blastocatellia bacterium]